MVIRGKIISMTVLMGLEGMEAEVEAVEIGVITIILSNPETKTPKEGEGEIKIIEEANVIKQE